MTTTRLSLTDADVRILLALVAEHDDQGRATVRSVAARAGRSVRVTHDHLRRLRWAEMVTWEDGTAGTLRPLVHTVTFGTQRRSA